MSDVFREFCDDNLHRVYPLADGSSGKDVTGSFKIPSNLISDIYLCVPDIPGLDRTKFYIKTILVRRFKIDVTIAYDDPGIPESLGLFKGIVVESPLHETTVLTPSREANTGALAALTHLAGQIVIGDARTTASMLGQWSFDPQETYILPSRVSVGIMSVQYISLANNFYSGVVAFKEGEGVTLSAATVGGETVITISAEESSGTVIVDDDDVIDALAVKFGAPISKINGILPDANRDFKLLGGDCTTVEVQAAGNQISNPCATPCCPEDPNIASLVDSTSALNLRYADLIKFYEATRDAVNDVQNKLLSLGNTL